MEIGVSQTGQIFIFSLEEILNLLEFECQQVHIYYGVKIWTIICELSERLGGIQKLLNLLNLIFENSG